MTDYNKESIKISSVKIKAGYALAFDYTQKENGMKFSHKNTEIPGQIPAKELVQALTELKQDVLYALEFPVSAALDEKRIKINSVSFMTGDNGVLGCSFS